MLDYILHFYNNYTSVFYGLLIVWVIFEGPIIILALCLLSYSLNISYLTILFFSFLWDFWWDMIHYFIWRFFKKKIFKDKNYLLLEKLNKKLEGHSLLDKLIVIKFTPPITSMWLFYLWFNKTQLKSFIKNDLILSVFSSILITTIWYNFWYLFKNNTDFWYLIVLVFISFAFFYFLLKFISKYLINKILNDK